MTHQPPGFENPTRTHVGNPAIPKVIPTAAKPAPNHQRPDTAARMVAWAHWGIEQRGHFVYDETVHRSDMFHRKPGDISTRIHADCSQFYASIAHWCGVKNVDDRDYTGTLLLKGKILEHPKPAACVIFGPATGTHAAMITERSGDDWWCIGFGHQGAPDRVLLSGLATWFRENGHPGVRYLSFTNY